MNTPTIYISSYSENITYFATIEKESKGGWIDLRIFASIFQGELWCGTVGITKEKVRKVPNSTDLINKTRGGCEWQVYNEPLYREELLRHYETITNKLRENIEYDRIHRHEYAQYED